MPVPKAGPVLRRPERDRHALLPDGAAARPHLLGADAARAAAGRAGRASTRPWSTRWPACTWPIGRRIGLDGFGRPGNYFARQIGRWSKQWEGSRTRDNPAIDRLAEWLPGHVPDERRDRHLPRRFPHRQHGLPPDRAARDRHPGLGTVDARPSAGRPRLSLPALYQPARGLPGHARPRPRRRSASRTMEAYVAAYQARTGRDDAITPFHLAFALFRLAVILEGVLARGEAGQRLVRRRRDPWRARDPARGTRLGDRS